jgi:hypothetical protein
VTLREVLSRKMEIVQNVKDGVGGAAQSLKIRD